MKAIVVTDQAAGTAGMKLVERPEPQGAVAHNLLPKSAIFQRIIGAHACQRRRAWQLWPGRRGSPDKPSLSEAIELTIPFGN